VHEKITGKRSQVVHHIDGNKINNTPENLDGLTRASHSKLHSDQLTPEERAARGAILTRPEVQMAAAVARPRGEAHPHWKDIPKFKLLRWAATGKGQIRKIMALSGMDFETLKRKFDLADIDLASIRKRYGSDGRFISRSRIEKASRLTQPTCYQSLGVGFYRYKELCDFYEVGNNHEVISIEPFGKADVYDLEVEDTHAFIASDICVHNSSKAPNLQNIPAKDKSIRRSFHTPETMMCAGCGLEEMRLVIPDVCPRCASPVASRDDYVMVFMDFNQMEVRMTAHYSEDPMLLEVYNVTHQDVHTRTMCELEGIDYDHAIEVLADESHSEHSGLSFQRKAAKITNFLIIYGGGAKNLAGKLSTPQKPYTEQRAEQFIKQYFAKLRGVRRWLTDTKMKIRSEHQLQNYFGRYRRFPELKVALTRYDQKWIVERCERQGCNYLIQGTCADLFKIAMCRVNKVLKGARTRIAMPIHDELIFYWHKSELHLLGEVTKQMQDWDFKVPMIVDVSYSESTWADKKALH
jgi:hypothetical protein